MGDGWVRGTTLGGAGPMRRRRRSSGAWPTPAPPMPACSPAHACVQRSVVVPARPQESEARTPLAWVQGELCAVILDDQTVRRKRRPSPAAV